ncbi:hypothetical protein PIB30_047897 [Stylosanthes scabra]|uniref:Uncharacterized protein n=1 Tax=Stylosanthes scabra TaxID=79078 RepID=A0ABU6RGX3_9FABA|nr:hypothetical protein [Stylosanthes scabra]
MRERGHRNSLTELRRPPPPPLIKEEATPIVIANTDPSPSPLFRRAIFASIPPSTVASVPLVRPLPPPPIKEEATPIVTTNTDRPPLPLFRRAIFASVPPFIVASGPLVNLCFCVCLVSPQPPSRSSPIFPRRCLQRCRLQSATLLHRRAPSPPSQVLVKSGSIFPGSTSSPRHRRPTALRHFPEQPTSYTRCLLPYGATLALPLKRHRLLRLRFGMHNSSSLEAFTWFE